MSWSHYGYGLNRSTHYEDGEKTDVQYCWCCGKPRPVEAVFSPNIRFTPFINGEGVWVCSECAAQHEKKEQPLKRYSLAALNPALNKYHNAVKRGKIDIGLSVVVTLADGSEVRGIKSKLPPDKVAY